MTTTSPLLARSTLLLNLVLSTVVLSSTSAFSPPLPMSNVPSLPSSTITSVSNRPLHKNRSANSSAFITSKTRATLSSNSRRDDVWTLRSSRDDNDETTVTTSPTTTSTTATATPAQQKKPLLENRAGEDGYSLLRRPVTFDADVDPTFEVPRAMDEEEDRRLRDGNREWFEGRVERRSRGILGEYANRDFGKSDNNDDHNGDGWSVDSNGLTGGARNNLQQKKAGGKSARFEESDQQLDMYQRTLDTLDYPLVLRALAKECSTVPGKLIVLSSTRAADAKSGGDGKTHKSKNAKQENDADGEEDDVDTMSLTATSVKGVHRRYTAVREMERLMDGRVSDNWVIYSRLQQKQEQQQQRRSQQKSNQQKRPPPQSNNQNKNRQLYRKPLMGPPIENHSFDIQPIFDIIDEGKVLDGPEILDVTTMLEIALDVMDWGKALEQFNEEMEEENKTNGNGDDLNLQPKRFVELPKLASSIQIDPDFLSLLTDAFDDEGKLSSTTFPSLGRLRSKVRTLKRDILSTVDSILSLPSTKEKLAVESGGALTMEINGRLVIPISQDKYSQNSMMGIVHDASRSGKTAYVEPTEIVGPTNELRQAEGELRAEEARVWRELTESIIRHRKELERNVKVIGHLDVVMGRVRLGRKLEGCVPEVGEEGVVSVKEARHPILLLRDLEGVVGSDVELGKDGNQGLILTGPNSGGKTVILKLLGLYAFMVRDGIPIPSKPNEPARVDFFTPVLADIGDLQSTEQDLSTFSGHMLVCREVLNNAGKNALVLMDELGSGTDPNQGVAIARALLEALLDRGCRVAITTHYLELKQLASTDDRFAVAGMQFVGGRPTYKLIPGMIGESFALAVAERLKLPQSVIERANELLDTETRKMGELIRDLEDQKLLVEQKAEELKKREVEMLELKAEMKKEKERLEQKQLNARKEEARKFAAKLEEKEKLLEDILEKLKGQGASKKVVADSWSDIRIVKRDVLNEAENIPGVLQRMRQQSGNQGEIELIPISEMKGSPKPNVGDKVIVCKKGSFYGKEGVVDELGKKVQVTVGGFPVRLSLKEIAFPPENGAGSTTKQSTQAYNQNMSKMARRAMELDSDADAPAEVNSSLAESNRGTTMKTNANTVNCIGCTFEESKRKCLDMFSRATVNNWSVIFILHGHGTGVLKQKIRAWLGSERQFVKKFRAADQADGGEALTRVELKRQNLF